MRNKGFAIAAALALAVAGTNVHAQSAAPLSVAASVQRSAAPDREAAERGDLAGRYGWLLPLALVTAAIAAVVFLSIDDDPTSP